MNPDFSPLSALMGGALIGLSAGGMLLLHGRVPVAQAVVLDVDAVADDAQHVVGLVVPVCQLVLHLLRQLPAIPVLPGQEVCKQALVRQAPLNSVIHG